MIEYVGSIEKQTLENTYFRRVLFTGRHAQLVVMCLQPGEAISDEVHPNTDQFFSIEQGEAKFVFNEKEGHSVHAGDVVVAQSDRQRSRLTQFAGKTLHHAKLIVQALCPLCPL